MGFGANAPWFYIYQRFHTPPEKYINKPKLYSVGTDMFWNNEHISKILLEAHLNPKVDSANRNLDFMDGSVKWITQNAPVNQFRKLLDLGCGPGIYSERFAKCGYIVTGIDFSERSIEYAKQQSMTNDSKIEYHYQNYLIMDYRNEFDLVTLIYCDYGELSTTDRRILLDKVYLALKPNGKFILDVFTSVVYNNKEEKNSWEYYSDGGF